MSIIDYDKRLKYTSLKQKVKMKKNIFLKFKIAITSLFILVFFIGNFGILASASSSSNSSPSVNKSVSTQAISSNCSVNKTEIRWWQITSPGQFLPIIPQDCATNADGTPKPLSIDILPDIIIRLFGFLVSLVWLLLLPVFVFAGLWYIWGGFDGQGSENAIKLIKNSLFGIVTLFIFYIAVFTVLTLLQANFLETDIKTFFTTA